MAMKPAQRSLIRLFSLIEGGVECVLVGGIVVGNGRVLGAPPLGDKEKVISTMRSCQIALRRELQIASG
ncbi:MAG: hypothetical protein B7Z37_18325 [Verrucomicrobia bacterium 12-59-8]|nr:MAG: hypothetical protein B7Z37_18325 [Verrucomicrobia bacterium 12-59-8]